MEEIALRYNSTVKDVEMCIDSVSSIFRIPKGVVLKVLSEVVEGVEYYINTYGLTSDDIILEYDGVRIIDSLDGLERVKCKARTLSILNFPFGNEKMIFPKMVNLNELTITGTNFVAKRWDFSGLENLEVLRVSGDTSGLSHSLHGTLVSELYTGGPSIIKELKSDSFTLLKKLSLHTVNEKVLSLSLGNLQELTISDSSIHTLGMMNTPKLKELSLVECGIEKIVSDSLRKCRKLHFIDLTGNDKLVEYPKDAFRWCYRDVEVIVGGTPLVDDGSLLLPSMARLELIVE